MKVKYYWTNDGVGEVCERTSETTSKDELCYHCNSVIPAGTPCVKLTALDGDIYWLHVACAKDSVDVRE